MDQTTTPTGTAKPRPRDSATGAVRVSTRKSPPKKRYIGANGFRSDVATLRAEGMTQAGVARTLGVNQSTIARVEKLPEVAERIAELRKIWADVAHSRINDVAGRAGAHTEEIIYAKDLKGVGNSLRGVTATGEINARPP